MSDTGIPAVWTPEGIVRLDGKKPERVELSAGVMEWFRQFSDVAAHFKLGLHCAKCHGDITGKNGDLDKTFAVACNCREFVGKNREYKPPATMPFYDPAY
jgi:hypothetical protein